MAKCKNCGKTVLFLNSYGLCKACSEAMARANHVQNDPTFDYVVIDLETSGLNVKTCEIIEVGGVRVENGIPVDYFSYLVRPEGPIDPNALAVNNITQAELQTAPRFNEIIPYFFGYIGSLRLVGHNIATFDLPILKRYADFFRINFNNDYEDLLHLARKKLPELPNKKLTTVAAYFKIDTRGAHRAYQDCLIAQKCYELLKPLPNRAHSQISNKQYNTKPSQQTSSLQELNAVIQGILADGILNVNEVLFLNDWLMKNTFLQGNYPYDRLIVLIGSILEDGVITQEEMNELVSILDRFLSGKLTDDACDLRWEAGKNIVLTGDFNYGSRDEMIELVTRSGGVIKKQLSSTTDFLVIGGKGSADWICSNYGSKLKQAKELQAKGNKVVILSEKDFFLIVAAGIYV